MASALALATGVGWLVLRRSFALRRADWLLSVAAVLLVASVWAPEARAGGVVSTCDEAHLNSALSGGGSVTFSCSGTITLTSAITISANTSIDGTGQTVTVSGGGAVQVFIVNFGVTLSLNTLTIANGNILFSGGVHNIGTLIVTNSTFVNNIASAGAIYNDGGTVIVTNSTFSANTAFGGGAGIQNSGGSATVINSTFSGNTADVNGGGIYNDSVGTLTVINSTFSGNTATYSGGGIYTAGGPVKVLNTVLANSNASAGNCGGTITDGGYNLSDDATCAFSASGSSNSVPTASLNLGALASNGGPTQTIAPGTGSMAIDAIPAGTNGCGTTVAEDQRGITRPQNFMCDIGAYEVVPAPATIVGRDGAPCNEAALDAAVARGGLVTFNCPIPTTIPLTSRITVSNNTALDGTGQTISISGGSLVGVFSINSGVNFSVNNLTIANGNATYGGGIINSGGELIVTNSTFSGNSSGSVGGGIYSSGALIVTNSTLSGNSAVSGGGGIYNDTGGTLALTNSTFSGNTTVNFGGAIEISGLNGAVVVNVTNSTFSGNSAPSNSGAIANFHGTLMVKNTILANNGIGGNCLLSNGAATSGGHNLSDDMSCSFFTGTGDVNNTAAGLDPAGLKNNGGPTQTIALQSTSPAVDAIAVNACTDVSGIPVITDQRGVFRPQGTACDIGAYELTPLSVAAGQAPTITSANSASFEVGQTVSFTVTTTGSPTPSLTETGTLPAGLTFVDNGNGTGTLSGTLATGTVTTYNITFTAQNGVTPNATQNFTLTITQAATMTSLMASPNPANSGQAVTLTATVTALAPSSGSPTGTVTFSDSGVALSCSGGSQTLAAGQATCQYAFTATGAHPLTAAYSGGTNFTSSNGGTSLTITAPPPPPPVPIMVSEPVTVSDTLFVTPLIVNFAPPAAAFSSAGLGFGGAGGPQQLSVSNVGAAPLVFASAPAISSTAFSITQTVCSNGATSLPTTLPSGGACVLTITYTPSGTPASDSGTLVFTDNAALSAPPSAGTAPNYTQTITLNGTGSGTGPLAPPSGTVTVPTINEPITVNDTPDLMTSPLPAGTLPLAALGVAYTQPFAVSGGIGTITWTTSGPVPAGLSLNSTTGVLSGTPTVVNATGSTFTVTATDSFGLSASSTVTLAVLFPFIRINAMLESFSADPPPGSAVVTTYTATLGVTNQGNVTASRLEAVRATLTITVGDRHERFETTTPLPVIVSNVAPGGTATILVSFPGSVGAPGTTAVLRIEGTYHAHVGLPEKREHNHDREHDHDRDHDRDEDRDSKHNLNGTWQFSQQVNLPAPPASP
jgi:hypothetical protein